MLSFLGSLAGSKVAGSAPLWDLARSRGSCAALLRRSRPRCGGRQFRLSVCSARGPRPNNEDSAVVAAYREYALVAVADGVGGLEKGEVASSIAVCTFLSLFAENIGRDPMEWMSWAFDEVHKVVSRESGGGATTLTAAVVTPWGVYVGNVGDSPLYVSGQYLYRITTELDEEGGYITQALGHGSYRGPHLYSYGFTPPYMVFAVTDGVDDVLYGRYEGVLSGALKRGSHVAKSVAQSLVCHALKWGTKDNATSAVAVVYRK